MDLGHTFDEAFDLFGESDTNRKETCSRSVKKVQEGVHFDKNRYPDFSIAMMASLMKTDIDPEMKEMFFDAFVLGFNVGLRADEKTISSLNRLTIDLHNE